MSIKKFLLDPCINLSGIVQEAELTVTVNAVQGWLKKDKPLSQKHIDKIEAFIVKRFKYKPEKDLYEKIEKVMNIIFHTISEFENARDYDRELTEQENQAYKVMNFAYDLIATSELVINDPRSFQDLEGEHLFRFGISASNSKMIEDVLQSIEK